ncbi:DUF3159 domain-containing protein [Isoptericola aurantiacus]|uniref:DUF3159 domain-containing protein n=1 Tax=Isoptericola aurantiacus TaxID=3377839 RepID=UPI00383B3F2C
MSSTPSTHPDQDSSGDGARRGVRALTGDTFSFAAAVGGVRGVVEAVLPGLVFVVVFVVTEDLTWSLVASCGAALLAVVARLVQRTPVTQALGGVLGIAVGVFWAWRTGEAEDFYAVGLWTNAAYLLAFLVSIAVRWPLVGLFVEAVRAGFSDLSGARRTPDDDGDATHDADGAGVGQESGASSFAALAAWRSDADLVRRYTIASWFWVGLFAVRLAVKVPLYLDGDVGWLGTMHLVLGVPLWGLVLWLTWVVVRGAHRGDSAGEPTTR